MSADKRRFPRIEHQGEAQFEIESLSASATIANISAGGALLFIGESELVNVLERGKNALMLFSLPSDPDEEFEVSVQISHFHLDDDSNYRIGVAFTDDNQDGVTAVRDFIEMFSAFLDR